MIIIYSGVMSDTTISVSTHPFCDLNRVENWELLTPEQALIDVEWAISLTEDRVNRILKLPEERQVFENTFGWLWWSDYELHMALKRINLLRSLVDGAAFLSALMRVMHSVTALSCRLTSNERLFSILTHVANKEKRRIAPHHIKNTLKGFNEVGIKLTPEQKQEFTLLQNKLGEDAAMYNQNITSDTDAWKYVTSNPEDIAGLPETCLAIARNKAEAENLPPGTYVFDLRDDNYYYGVTFAGSPKMRAMFTDASSHIGLDNEEVVKRIVLNRAKKAKLLGYETFAAMALDGNLLDNTKDLREYMATIYEDLKEPLQEFLRECREKAGDAEKPLAPSDVAYYQEKIRKERYSYNIDDTRKYFPLGSVLGGLFSILEEKLNVVCRKSELGENERLWHPSVQVYEVFCDGELLGDLYFDLYNRPGKASGAWSLCLQAHYEKGNPFVDGAMGQKAQQVVVANFRNDTANEDMNGLDHSELETLFHEVGHAIHAMLSKPHYPVQEASCVERDFIEVPSTIMEFLTWEKDVLYKLNEKANHRLPEELADKIVSCKDRLRAWIEMRQLLYNEVDQMMHGMTVEQAKEFSRQEGKLSDYVAEKLAALYEVAPELSLVMMVPYHFKHIFGGGYAAQYYSYLFADRLSREEYGYLAEEGEKEWKNYRKCVLERGSLVPADEMLSDLAMARNNS